MRSPLSHFSTGALFYLMTILGCLGQAAPVLSSPVQESASPIPGPSQNPPTLQAFRTEQQALAQSFSVLIAQGASPSQIQVWQQANAVQLSALQQQAKTLVTASTHPLPILTEISVPEGVTQEMSDLLVTRADLANRYAQLYNQQMQAGAGQSATTNIAAAFQQQNAAELQAQQQKIQSLAAQVEQQPISLPPPLHVPANVSPQLAALLTARDQLMRDRIVLENQYLTATPAVRETAVVQWEQQNAARVQQLRQMAENLQNNPTN